MNDTKGFDKIVGHDYVKKCLLALNKKDIPNTMIFTGAKGVGKLTAAVEYSLLLMCENPLPNGACYECHSCKSYEKSLNPNIAFWYPKGQNTSIEQMRNLKNLSNFAPLGSKYKINIIQDADTLNEESSNSILKIMEEPPDYLVNILLYDNPANIIPTLRSRAYVLNFSPLSNELVYRYLNSKYSDQKEIIDFVSRYAMGCIGRARLLMECDNLDEIRELVYTAVGEIISNPFAIEYLAEKFSSVKFSFPEISKESNKNLAEVNVHSDRVFSVESMNDDDLKSNEQGFVSKPPKLSMTSKDCVLELLDMLALYLRDLSLMKLENTELINEQIINIDKIEFLQFHEKSFGEIKRIMKCIDIIWSVKEKIKGNMNINLCLESLFSKMIFNL